MFSKCKKLALLLPGAFIVLLIFGFNRSADPENNFRWIEQCLRACYDASSSGSIRLKKWELSVTDKGFFRLKKTFVNGKQEYFSFRLNRFRELSYLGTAAYGTVIIKTISDDIIVQTFNDPKGNIDSMAQRIDLPVNNIEPETLDTLKHRLSVSLPD